MLQVLHFFHNNGLSVSLLLYKKEGELLEQLNPEIPVYELACSGTKEAVRPLINFCNKNKVELLFATLGASVAAALAKPLLPKKLRLISRLGSTYGAEKETIKNPVKKLIYTSLTKHMAIMTDILIFQSHYMENDFLDFIKIDKLKCHVIYNPINSSEVSLKSKEKAIASDLVSIGSLLPAKDHITLIKSIQLLKELYSKPISLFIIGGGPLEESLKTLVDNLGLNDEVKFLGHQSNPYKYLSKSKYLISSSIYEGFSNVILESLALGVPVIATDCPSGNKEIVKEGENGFFTEVGNSEKMAEVINRALKDRDKFNSELIASSVRDKFDIEHIGKEYINIIKG